MLATLMFFSTISVAQAKYEIPPMPDGYDDPGLEPQNVLQQIIRKLRTTLKDPYSIRDFQLCKADASKPLAPVSKYDRGWQPARWSVMFAFNSKNGFGGYTGQGDARAYFDKQGLLEEVYYPNRRVNSALDAEMNRLTEKLLERCDRIPNEKIQILLQ
jgi:hypothetical protein